MRLLSQRPLTTHLVRHFDAISGAIKKVGLRAHVCAADARGICVCVGFVNLFVCLVGWLCLCVCVCGFHNDVVHLGQ